MTSARVAAIEAALQPGAHEEADHRARILERVRRGTAVPPQASRVDPTPVKYVAVEHQGGPPAEAGPDFILPAATDLAARDYVRKNRRIESGRG